MTNIYIIINTILNQCVNTIVWDDITTWTPPNNCIAQLSDGSINLGDIVQLVSGGWEKSLLHCLLQIL